MTEIGSTTIEPRLRFMVQTLVEAGEDPRFIGIAKGERDGEIQYMIRKELYVDNAVVHLFACVTPDDYDDLLPSDFVRLVQESFRYGMQNVINAAYEDPEDDESF